MVLCLSAVPLQASHLTSHSFSLTTPPSPQLEDDIVAKPNYFATMKNFALQLSSEDWMILEFSQLGFIGNAHEHTHMYTHTCTV